MRVTHYTNVPPETVEQGAEGVLIREVITRADGAPSFSMRVFDLEPGGHTPQHDHPWEHQVFILEGRGTVWSESEGDIPLAPGDTVLVMPGERHQFRSAGEGVFRFICLIPNLEDRA
ncbi:MAG: cupin domain-containing protein [Armatimonadia bacterium]|nr:cupin domain-containing protein [Armatimonadia bacterium]